MKKNTFGKTGFEVSQLGFGAPPVGYLNTEYEKTERILNFLLDNQVNVIDTAASYPGSEEAIGKAIARRRGEYVLVSKGGSDKAISAPAWSADHLTQSIDRSLQRLQTDHIDVLLLHSCSLEVLKQGEALAALVEARDAGKIRFAGYSGDNEAAAYAAGLPDIAVIETSISIADQRNIDTVLPLARRNNIGIIAKRPIANAAWKGKANQHGIYGDYAAPYEDRLNKMQLKPSELGFPDDGNDSWSELALRFTLSQAGVHTAIIGTTNLDHARANIAAAAKGPLPPEVIEKIQSAFRQADPKNEWVGQT